MRLLIGTCTAYNENTATENMNHCSIYCPIEWTVYYMKWEQQKEKTKVSSAAYGCSNEWYMYLYK